MLCLLFLVGNLECFVLQAGQMSSVSPSKALPLSICVPHQASPNKFIPIRNQEDDEALSLKSGKVRLKGFCESEPKVIFLG